MPRLPPLGGSCHSAHTVTDEGNSRKRIKLRVNRRVKKLPAAGPSSVGFADTFSPEGGKAVWQKRFVIVLPQYIQRRKQQIYCGGCENGAVKAVESAAVSGQKPAVILHAEFTLDKGECKVAERRGKAAYQCGKSQHGEVYAHGESEAEQNSVKKGEANGYDKAADAALDGLFGTGAGRQLVLAEKHTREKCAAVACVGDNDGQQHGEAPVNAGAQKDECRHSPGNDKTCHQPAAEACKAEDFFTFIVCHPKEEKKQKEDKANG